MTGEMDVATAKLKHLLPYGQKRVLLLQRKLTSFSCICAGRVRFVATHLCSQTLIQKAQLESIPNNQRCMKWPGVNTSLISVYGGIQYAHKYLIS